MDSSTDLLAAADEYLEANQFAKARDAYRAVLLSGQSSAEAIINRGVAEQEEELAFLRHLAEAYPENIDFQLALAQRMVASHYASHAHRLCSTLLERPLRARDQFLVRRIRVGAALRSGRLECLVDDLTKLWNPPEIVNASAQFRKGLLRDIAAISDPVSIPTLELVATEPWVNESFRRFLVCKIAELQTLATAVSAESLQ
jgi:hypothetical protein